MACSWPVWSNQGLRQVRFWISEVRIGDVWVSEVQVYIQMLMHQALLCSLRCQAVLNADENDFLIHGSGVDVVRHIVLAEVLPASTVDIDDGR